MSNSESVTAAEADGSQLVPSTCWECGAICGSMLTVRDGKVLKIGPNAAHPASKGAFCVKGIRAVLEWTYQSSRLRTPLRRVGPRGSGRFEEVSWTSALDQMAEQIASTHRTYGPLSIVGATNGAFFSRSLFVAQLMRSIGSPNWMINQDLCGGCRGVSEKMTGLDITGGEDIENARCALIVGRNPAVADPIQWMALKRARQGGTKIVVIDPFRTTAAELADLWLSPRPGTDAVVAMAMIKILIDRHLYDADFVADWCHGFDALSERVAPCSPEWAESLSGVPAADIVKAALLYADGPSTFLSGHGIDAVSNGVQTFRAYHCLVGISGNVDRVGGNRRSKKPTGFKSYFDVLFDRNFRLPPEVESERIGAARFPLWAGELGFQMACHNPSVIDAILTGDPYPVKALYASGANIAVMYPDTHRTLEALQKLDLFVVAAHTMTPTAAWADLVLPKTTTLEEEQVMVHQAGPCVTYTAAASAREGDVRSDLDIAVALVERLAAMGIADPRLLPWKTQREFNDYLASGSDVDMARLQADGYQRFSFELGAFDQAPFRTPSKKIELLSQPMAAAGLDPLPAYVAPAYEQEPPAVRADYPLILQTGMREKTYHHSRFREQPWARKVSPDPHVYIHPRTAAEANVEDGSWVLVETPGAAGSCRLKVRLTEDTKVGVLTTGVGWWLPEAPAPYFGARDVNINAALPYGRRADPYSGSADTRGVACRLRALAADA